MPARAMGSSSHDAFIIVTAHHHTPARRHLDSYRFCVAVGTPACQKAPTEHDSCCVVLCPVCWAVLWLCCWLQVILLQDIEKLGRQGDLLTVKVGYWRNFLLPQGQAKVASQDILE